MRIAFIPSAYRTVFFREVGARLEAAGHEVYWLSPNRRWAHWLERHGTPSARILDVTRWGESWSRRRDRVMETELIAELEAKGTLTLNNIILMDPLLSRRSREHALSYLGVCAREVQRFLHEHSIDVVSGEQTWAFELLVGQVCVAAATPFLNPHTIRIPDPRFAFFVNHTEATLLEIGEVTDAERLEAKAQLTEFRRREPQPVYMAINRAVVQPRASRLRLLSRHVLDLVGDRYDETSRRPLGLIADHTLQVLRRQRNLRWTPFEKDPATKSGRPYVLFPLHKQPEASIDIKGAPYNNQVELLRALARTLPATHDLLVKEHDFALATRAPSFYRQLMKMPGVRLVHPAADIFSLTRNADLVVTVTGTAAYEASLLGRRAATIAPIFFEKVVPFPRFDPFEDSLARLLAAPAPVGEWTSTEFLAWVIAHSCPGVVGDALWLPQGMEPENIEQIAQGFERAFEGLAADVASGTP